VALLVIAGAALAIWRWSGANSQSSGPADANATGRPTAATSTQSASDSNPAGAPLKQIESFDSDGDVVTMTLSPDGYWLAWGLAERGAGVNVQHVSGTGQPIALKAVGFTAETTSAAFLDNQTLLATMGDAVYVGSIRNRNAKPFRNYPRDKFGIPLCVAGQRNGGKVRAAIGLSSGVIELADVEVLEGVGLLDGDPQPIPAHKGPVRDIAFLANGRNVASVSEDATLRVISADDGKLVTAQPISDQGTGPEFGRSLAMLSNSTGEAWLGTTARNQAVAWDPRRWTVVHRLGAGVHRGTVTRLAFSRANLLATASADALSIWSLETGKEIARATNPHGGRTVGGLVFSPDGATLFSGGADGHIRKWAVTR
jgi:hypothetical protein